MSAAKPVPVETKDQPKPKPRGGRAHLRRNARELVVQALYQWQLAQPEPGELVLQFAESELHAEADAGFFRKLLHAAIESAGAIEAAAAPHLDRPWAEVSPIERAILLLGGQELMGMPETPYRVVINEAIELAKRYGGTDGHKYINGVLDKLAASVRADEIGRADPRPPRPASRG